MPPTGMHYYVVPVSQHRVLGKILTDWGIADKTGTIISDTNGAKHIYPSEQSARRICDEMNGG